MKERIKHFLEKYPALYSLIEKGYARFRYLEQCGIEVLVSWYLSKPLHYHEALNLAHFQLPKTEQFAKESVSLPLNTEISDEQVEFVINSIRSFYKR